MLIRCSVSNGSSLYFARRYMGWRSVKQIHMGTWRPSGALFGVHWIYQALDIVFLTSSSF